MKLGLMTAGTLQQMLISGLHSPQFLNSLVVLVDTNTLGMSEIELYRQWLGPAEQARIAAIKDAGAAANSIVGRALARSMAGLWWGCSPQAVNMAESESGKPHLRGPDQTSDSDQLLCQPLLHFSVTHHRHWVAVAFALTAVGIDIEYPVETDRLKLARRFFLDAESARLEALSGPDRNRYFTYLWTLKEAEVKRTGSALARVMGQVGFAIEAPKITRIGASTVSSYQLYKSSDAMLLALAHSSASMSEPVFLQGHPLVGYQTFTPEPVASSIS